ncbi:hypothetical protein G6F37_010926 [Rhizopus arrhizus]|nr:hypothetical protein G6F38_011013 [Rhizopus arrhizus]KAG1151737.1 hypothetical protein G6F37_010926 [Rhizopus arrhizus]
MQQTFHIHTSLFPYSQDDNTCWNYNNQIDFNKPALDLVFTNNNPSLLSHQDFINENILLNRHHSFSYPLFINHTDHLFPSSSYPLNDEINYSQKENTTFDLVKDEEVDSTQKAISFGKEHDVAKVKEKERKRKNKTVSKHQINSTRCFNCRTGNTPLWRRNPQGQPLCNACGLFFKLHGTVRPLSLKTDIIKKRNRNQTKRKTTRRKCQYQQDDETTCSELDEEEYEMKTITKYYTLSNDFL